MLTREQVLVELAVNGGMRTKLAAIYKVDTGRWRVNHWGIECRDFAEDNLIAAIDAFIGGQPITNEEFPDADDIREFNQKDKDAEYLQWCEDHADALHVIAKSILQANYAGKRTIEIEIPSCEAVRHYIRFFREKHYDTEPQPIVPGKSTQCKISWGYRKRG